MSRNYHRSIIRPLSEESQEAVATIQKAVCERYEDLATIKSVNPETLHVTICPQQNLNRLSDKAIRDVTRQYNRLGEKELTLRVLHAKLLGREVVKGLTSLAFVFNDDADSQQLDTERSLFLDPLRQRSDRRAIRVGSKRRQKIVPDGISHATICRVDPLWTRDDTLANAVNQELAETEGGLTVVLKPAIHVPNIPDRRSKGRGKNRDKR